MHAVVAEEAFSSSLATFRGHSWSFQFGYSATMFQRANAWMALLLATCAGKHFGGQQQRPMAMLAPDFSGIDHLGRRVTSESLRGYGSKGLVLWFYPKAGTGG